MMRHEVEENEHESGNQGTTLLDMNEKSRASATANDKCPGDYVGSAGDEYLAHQVAENKQRQSYRPASTR